MCKPKSRIPWGITIASLFIALAFSVIIGPVRIPAVEVVGAFLSHLTLLDGGGEIPRMVDTIIFQVRLPNAILVAMTGMALAGSGAAYQGLFRNPLADPYVIGVASGAGLGAVLAMTVRWPETILGMAAIPIAAFAGAMITVVVVFNIARIGRTARVTTLILAGVAVSSFATALTSMIMILSADELHRAVNWLVGGFALGGWGPVIASIPYLAIGLGFLCLLGRQLNVLQFGDDQARQVGLQVERVQIVIVVAASLVAATAVAFSGIIAFVGLIVPHFVRMLWGSDYRRLVPLAILAGGSFLLLADIVARVALAPRQLPVGIVTALVGVPFFLWLLAQSKSRESPW
jgi:iron complex transport system permease protein